MKTKLIVLMGLVVICMIAINVTTFSSNSISDLSLKALMSLSIAEAESGEDDEENCTAEIKCKGGARCTCTACIKGSYDCSPTCPCCDN